MHGAWADVTGFTDVISELTSQGFWTVGVANPLRNLISDAAYVAETLRSIDGHRARQGPRLPNGWVPDEGDGVQQFAELNERSLLPPALRPVPFTASDGREDVDLYIDQDAFAAAFAGDVDPESARVMAVAQRPPSGSALGTPSGAPAWKAIPSWYLLGTDDKAIPPATPISC